MGKNHPDRQGKWREKAHRMSEKNGERRAQVIKRPQPLEPDRGQSGFSKLKEEIQRYESHSIFKSVAIFKILNYQTRFMS